MNQNRGWIVAGVFAAILCGAFVAHAGDHCDRCGASANCKRVCRIVKEEKKLTSTCWGIQSEEFCIGGPSCEKCEKCESVCNGKEDCEKANAQPKKMYWKIWEPSSCAHIFTKKKLMKRTVTKSIPSFKWVVEDLCSDCKSQDPPTKAEPQ